MKKRINISIEEDLHLNALKLAKMQNTNFSSLLESLIETEISKMVLSNTLDADNTFQSDDSDSIQTGHLEGNSNLKNETHHVMDKSFEYNQEQLNKQPILNSTRSEIVLLQEIQQLPIDLQQQVLNFAQFLKNQKQHPKTQRMLPGILNGSIEIPDDFNDPLEDFNEYMF
jgi:hypothetical protein